MSKEDIEKGIPLSEEDRFWIKKMQDLAGESIASVEEAAKQLVGMITVMEALYGAVLAFSGIKEVPKGNMWAVGFYASPILLWLVALFFTLRVFKTREYDYYSTSPDSAKGTFEQIARFKYRNLNWAYGFICASFIWAAIGIMYWLYFGAMG